MKETYDGIWSFVGFAAIVIWFVILGLKIQEQEKRIETLESKAEQNYRLIKEYTAWGDE